VNGLAILQAFRANFAYEKIYLAVAALDNSRDDICGRGNKGLITNPRNPN
jgi:hypothetical protein